MKSYKLFLILSIIFSIGANSISFAQCGQVREIIGETQSDHFGEVVVGGSDINGDGVPDIIVGAPNYSIHFESTMGAGKVYVYSGADRSLLFSIEPENPANTLGIGLDVDTLGDINHDGYGDFIFGVDNWIDSLGEWHPDGAALVYSGKDFTPIHIIYGDQDFDRLGKVVSCIGDITKDGVNDFLAGGYSGYDNVQSGIKIYNGATGAEIIAFTTTWDESRTGQDACGVGDLDGDTYPDFVMGIPFYSGAHEEEGRINAYSGKTFELLWTVYGDSAGAMLGGHVSGAGDVNADGYPDVICGIGDEIGFSSGAGHGFALIISGIDGSIIRRVESPDLTSQVRFGWAVAGLGDLNHDGYDDYAVGDYHRYTLNAGRAWVFSGFDGSLMDRFRAQGNSISTAGDLNGDGTPDVLIGSYRTDTDSATMVGRLHIELCVYPDSDCAGDPDFDNDGWNDMCDNCPFQSNGAQIDTDSNGVGDMCTDSIMFDVGSDLYAYHDYGNVTFDSVSSPGAIIVEKVADAPPNENMFIAIPQDAPAFFNISTTCTFEGNIKICIGYDPFGMTQEDEEAVKLYHFNGTVWEDITTLADPLGNQVCGVVSSLSPFGVGFAKIPTDIDDDIHSGIPTDFTLSQNYPNPFNPQTTISYSLPSKSDVNITIVNVLGETVRMLINETMPAGLHKVTWDGKNNDGIETASGVYFYKIVTDNMTLTKKMMLLK